MKLVSTRILTLTLLLGSALSAQAVTFADDFSVNQSSVSLYTTTMTNSGYVDLADGSKRSIGLAQSVNENPGDTRSRIGISNGALSLSNDAGVTSNGFVSYYMPTAKNYAGLTGFTVDFLSNDIASTMTAYVFDLDSNFAVYSVGIPGQTSAFSRTLTYTSGNVDLTRVNGISFKMGGVMDEDIRIDGIRSVQTVPEPTSMAALGLGAVGLLRRRAAKK